MKKIGKILLGFIIVLAAIIGIIVWLTAAPVKVAKSHVNLLKEGKFNEAYNLTSTDFKASTSRSEFNSFILQYPDFIIVEKMSITSRNITSGGVATIKGNLVLQNGTERPIKYQLIKESGEWRVLIMHYLYK